MKSLEEIHPYISIHALLAESDAHQNRINKSLPYFYPRSPCGERPNFHRVRYNTVDISIHALLAESDSNILVTSK